MPSTATATRTPTTLSHGTHTAGTMAAVGNNGIGITGVAWQARIMALKFLGPGGGTSAGAIACIDYVVYEKVNHGVNVVAINNSWGGGAYNSLLRDAINAAGAASIVFVAAAGNGGADGIGDDNDVTPSYPAFIRLRQHHRRGGHRPQRRHGRFLELRRHDRRPGRPRRGHPQHGAGRR